MECTHFVNHIKLLIDPKKCHENGKAMIENGKKNYLEAWDTFDWLHHTFIYQ